MVAVNRAVSLRECPRASTVAGIFGSFIRRLESAFNISVRVGSIVLIIETKLSHVSQRNKPLPYTV